MQQSPDTVMDIPEHPKEQVIYAPRPHRYATIRLIHQQASEPRSQAQDITNSDLPQGYPL
jgi:hypothetical protein